MFASTKSVFLLLAFHSLLFKFGQSSCSEAFNDLIKKSNITNCRKLSTLKAELGWNYIPNSHNKTAEVEIIFGISEYAGVEWIAWGLNPGHRPEMVGTRAMIGIMQKNGALEVNLYNITSNNKLGCELAPSKIEFQVLNMKGEVSSSSSYMTISGTLVLDTQAYNVKMLNHVWQVGYDADRETLVPRPHSFSLQNFDSSETLNLTYGGDSQGVGRHRRYLRTVHGILNIVGWGILLPVGVIVARYFRKFPVEWRNWFSLHLGCQIVGYILGTAGWGIGLWLGRASRHYSFKTHQLLGIFIFTFTTLQMLALRLRPKPHDDYRKYWDMYHHFLGYALLAAIAVNMFQGIAILKPDTTWKWAYIAVLMALGVATLTLEIVTWTKFCRQREMKKKKKDSTQESQQGQSASNNNASKP
ncbi:cytochrome b561 and DOMON domain-containing protein At3g25290-like [Humulus lupulus]|uniref:cytochrome b561 and DOMON domain-containing protein At3g25290-like n=1 Tax=Humulus lupulus TaxID=3486 RepID=UPI002B4021A2|nr:cytochrome b561 and DOMON domain-containing protein At3g25290-like [Humulus lupulus]